MVVSNALIVAVIVVFLDYVLLIQQGRKFIGSIILFAASIAIATEDATGVSLVLVLLTFLYMFAQLINQLREIRNGVRAIQ